MGGHCQKHDFEPAIDVCGGCLGEYCRDCVVYPFGLRKLPYCMQCAVNAAGVRAGASPRPMSRARRREALSRREQLQARRAAGLSPATAFG